MFVSVFETKSVQRHTHGWGLHLINGTFWTNLVAAAHFLSICRLKQHDTLSALFWDWAQPGVIVLYQRFGTTCRSHFQGLNRPRNVSLEPTFCAVQNPREVQISITSRRQPEITLSELFANSVFLCACMSDIFNEAEPVNFINRYFRFQNLWF